MDGAPAAVGKPAEYPRCLAGAFDPPEAGFCPMTDADVEAGYLVHGRFEIAWIDGACEPPDGAVAEFLTAVPGVRAGGHVVCTAAGVEPGRARFAGTDANGLVVRLPRGDAAALRDALAALPGETVPQLDPGPARELSRSAPVVTEIGGQALHVQGTFELRDGDDGGFPRTTGHLYAFSAAHIGPSDTAYSSLPAPRFDAAEGIPTPRLDGCPTPFSSSCRTVFANTAPGARPEVVLLDRTAAPALRRFWGAGAERIIARVLGDGPAPRLGGVDRSTPAVIPSSPLAGERRPTVIYAGALDGMLHAVCAERLGGCAHPGQELWAFLPRAQLASVTRNTQRIDGSPQVTDVFVDVDGDGRREWRTILAFQTGGGQPAIYALDVTDPFSPALLWDAPAPGHGLGVVIGPVRAGGRPAARVFAHVATDGGTAVLALDAVTGELAWTFETAGADPAVPIPAGPSAVDLDGTGALTHVLAPTPAGALWLLDAGDGAAVHGDAPLFRFGSGDRPVAAAATVFAERATGRLHAAVASAGAAGAQLLVAVPLRIDADAAPLDETSEQLAFAVELPAGHRVYAQPTVAGNELFLVTETTDPTLDTYGESPPTGRLARYDLDEGAALGATVPLSGGASPVDVTAGGAVHAGSATAARRIDYGDTFDADGITTELVFRARTGRQVWLRLR